MFGNNATNDQRTKFLTLVLAHVELLLMASGLAAPREADFPLLDNHICGRLPDFHGSSIVCFFPA
jgi:hypothetical protein